MVEFGLKDESKWVKDCDSTLPCENCPKITSANCDDLIYLCVIIKNNTDAECEISCYYRLYKDDKQIEKSSTRTKKLKPGESKQFFSKPIWLIGDACADYRADIVAWIESCITTCELSCQSSCQKECQSSCEKSCQTTCEKSCQSSCQYSCQSTCESICQSTCKVSCQTTCQKECQTTCEKICQSTCETFCQGKCETTCEETCELTCQETCEKTCQQTCESFCQTEEEKLCEGCETTCQLSCQEPCEVAKQLCETTCETTCQLFEELKCPIMVVSYGTPLVDSLEPLRRIRKILPSLILKTYYSNLHLKIARRFRRILYPPLLILTKLINYISKQH